MKTVALFLASLLLALGLGEAIVRVAGLGDAFLTRGALHEYQPEYGWRCLPNLDALQVGLRSFEVRIRCNSQGLRGGELPLEKPPGTLRIAVLGDSFMWGFGVEDDEVFAHRLAEELPGSQSVNLGVNGFSTLQELVRLETQGLAYDPDWTVVGFFWNDLQGNFSEKGGGRPFAEIAESGELIIRNRPVRHAWRPAWHQWLRQNSRLVAFAEYGLKLATETLKYHTRPELEEVDEDFHPGQFPPGAMRFREHDLYMPPTPESEHAWEGLRLILEQIDQRQRALGGRTLVMFVPSKYTMTPSQFSRLFGADPGLDWNRPARNLAEITTSLGIEYLDLNPLFREASDPLGLFLLEDAHWNAAGHALAARAVAERIRAVMDASREPALAAGPAGDGT